LLGPTTTRFLLLPALLTGCSADPIATSSPATLSSSVSSATTTTGPSELCESYATCSAVDGAAEELPAALLGTGDKCYVPLESNDTVPIIGGPQGGFHIWVALRSAGLGDEVIASYRVLDTADDSAITLSDPIERIVELCPIGEGWNEAAKLYAQLDAFTIDEVGHFVGRTIRLGVTLRNSASASASAEATLKLGPVVKWSDNELED